MRLTPRNVTGCCCSRPPNWPAPQGARPQAQRAGGHRSSRTRCARRWDGARLAYAIERARSVLGPDDVLPGVAMSSPRCMSRQSSTTARGSRWSRIRSVGDWPGCPGALLPGPPHAEPRPSSASGHQHRDRPVSVTSHFHFFEANPRSTSRAPRPTACGSRTRRIVRPLRSGESAEVVCCRSAASGSRSVRGLVDGPLDAPARRKRRCAGQLRAVPGS